MINLLRGFALLTGTFLTTGYAAPPAHCDTQARDLAVKAGSVFSEMSARQRAELQKLAAEVCAEHTTTAAATPENESSGDWFSERVLEGEPADKPGNRRLERRGR